MSASGAEKLVVTLRLMNRSIEVIAPRFVPMKVESGMLKLVLLTLTATRPVLVALVTPSLRTTLNGVGVDRASMENRRTGPPADRACALE